MDRTYRRMIHLNETIARRLIDTAAFAEPPYPEAEESGDEQEQRRAAVNAHGSREVNDLVARFFDIYRDFRTQNHECQMNWTGQRRF